MLTVKAYENYLATARKNAVAKNNVPMIKKIMGMQRFVEREISLLNSNLYKFNTDWSNEDLYQVFLRENLINKRSFFG